MEQDFKDIIIKKFGSQANFAKTLNWSRQKLNKIILKQREAKVSEINLMAKELNISVSAVIDFLS